ncbi:MAG: hypothetical protein AB7M05_21020 [Alphaproteobacteria bacterium]
MSAVLASRLNLLAKADPLLWERCTAQDLSDGLAALPSNIGRRDQGAATSRPTRRSTSGLQSSFDDARTLKISADLRKGWRQRRNTWGFVGSDLIPALNGHSVRVQLALLSGSKEEPAFAANEGRDLGISCRVEAQYIELAIELFDEQHLFNPELRWSETKNGKPLVFRDTAPSRLAPQGDPGQVWTNYLFKLWLIVQPPEKKPDPIYFEWSKRFFPGGLPSLGKRHS